KTQNLSKKQRNVGINALSSEK
ncbi:TPA: hypothetical protein ACIICM_004414, partial [Salmonella enterica subsp. enterica serovar Typhimurium]